MNDLIIYLLKVSAGLGIIALPYYFLLRNDPNLMLKRAFLQLGLVAAWIIPFVVFRRPEMILQFTPTVFIDPNAADLSPIIINSGETGRSFSIPWMQLLLFLYLAGMAMMLVKNLHILFSWNAKWKRMKNSEGIAFTESDQVFTLFSRIFIPKSLQEDEDLHHVLLHEKAHVQQLHFVDLLLVEITLMLTWFNPFSWLISRMIKENHEHLADRQVLSAGVNPARYRAQLLNHTLGVNVFRLGNQFNHSLTIKRFKMMKKPFNSNRGLLKMGILIPAILLSLALTTGMTPEPKTIKGKVVFADGGAPAAGAAVVVKGTTMGTVVDIDGTFKISVEGDPDLVISFVGYETLVIPASKAGKKTIKLEITNYEMDLQSVPIKVSQTDDGAISINSTFPADKNPVIVLDGKVVQNVDNIDPNTIEKIDVLKDPSNEQVKKYKAKDGLILITSKEAASEKKQDELEHQIFYVVESMPSFPGGKAALKTHIYSRLKYPETAKKEKITGEVQVKFIVDREGKVKDIGVLKSTYKGFDKAALDAFKDMPDWNPGSQRGKKVNVRVVVPVKFELDQ